MIIELPQSEANSLGFEITGTVTVAEQLKWIEKIEETLSVHEKVNILVVLNEGASWGLDAGIEDVKWVMRHMSRIKKIVFVSSSNVWNWLISIDSFFAGMVGIQEKHFDHADLEAAWVWIKA